MQGDFSRLTFDASRHFRNVRRQQGRVDVDSDWNEQVDIASHRIETETKDIVGPCGVPKHAAAFQIVDPTSLPSPPLVVKPGDFLFSPGRAYVDGILCENEALSSYATQPDLRPALLDKPGRYFVYLDVWLRHICALDEPPIREVALGGPDTAARTKTVWQLRTLRVGESGAAIGCQDDPREWLDTIAPSTAKLSARAAKEQQADSPCILPPGAGYRRLENQHYRVEIHRGGLVNDADKNKVATCKWSRENGSVVAGIERMSVNKITLTSLSQISAASFVPSQWIELLDDRNEWERTPGVLVPIQTVDDLTLTLDIAQAIEPGANALNSFATSLNAQFNPKVRRWDSAGVLAAIIPGSNDGFIALEDGVEVKFAAGSCKTGDYWQIPARMPTADVEWSRDPASGDPLLQLARGIEHHYCRVAVIEGDTNGKVTLIEDCRRIFPPLTELTSGCDCCTLTVDAAGTGSHRTLQEAVDALPKTGGHICVLPGTHRHANVRISGKQNVTISGCGSRSLLLGERSERAPAAAIITIEKSQNIRIESLAFGLDVEGAVAVVASRNVSVVDCDIHFANPRNSLPAIYLEVEDGLVERNRIGTIAGMRNPGTSDGPPTEGGSPGIQLAGGSRRVRIVENFIGGVSGQGITLGSLDDADPNGGDRKPIPGPPRDPTDPCRDRSPLSTRILARYINFTLQTPRVRHAAEPLEEIRIERNRILAAGLDGIGVAGFFDLREADEFVSVQGLKILENEIRSCLRRAPAPIDVAMKDYMGYGGIALADVSNLVIRDNRIEGNGVTHPFPVCGIFILHAEGMEIGRNQILANGALIRGRDELLKSGKLGSGRLGAVQVVFAVAPVAAPPSMLKVNMLSVSAVSGMSEPTGLPALHMHDNVVHAPIGQALSVVALGPVIVSDNRLGSGSTLPNNRESPLVPGVVFIFNVGLSNENYARQMRFAKNGAAPSIAPGLDDFRVGGLLVNGNVSFTDNQCTLDLLEAGRGGVHSATTIISLDDVAFLNNQCECSLRKLEDYVVTNAVVTGSSVRVTGNRFKEGLFQAAYSAITTGTMNTTVNNQSTHCLKIDGGAALTINAPNSILVNSMPGHQCEPRLFDALQKLAIFRSARL